MESLELKEIYKDIYWALAVPFDAEEILEKMRIYAISLNFPEVTASIEPVKLAGGFLMGKKEDVALIVRCNYKKFKKLRAFFRAQNFGNVGIISYYGTTSSSFFDIVTSRSTKDRLEAIKLSLSDVALVEYFEAFNRFCEFVHDYGTEQISSTQ